MSLFLRSYEFIKLILFFIKELVMANLQVAQWVLKNPEGVRPALLEIPLRVRREDSILMLSSMITLTPGTLSLDLSEDRRKLWVHCFHADDPAAVVESIQRGFEDRILRVFPETRPT